MEEKKSPQANLDQQRTTGFLLGLVLVLALLFVALEWNSIETVADESTLDLSDLVHEDEMIPMSIEEKYAQLEPDKSEPKDHTSFNSSCQRLSDSCRSHRTY